MTYQLLLNDSNSATRFKSYLQSILLEMTFQRINHSLLQGTASTPLSHNLYYLLLTDNIMYHFLIVKFIFKSNLMKSNISDDILF